MGYVDIDASDERAIGADLGSAPAYFVLLSIACSERAVEDEQERDG